ncbi:bacillithiol system redox-active protein YtxJ [Segetibacter sp.]|jgi:bacillithiol system protein YtxJ|uniref:bacillithiol system redox-active protein YtxJ n=1 Tax=Segetibacter sp. TaxID=2231182 RepID=UPI002628D665|nr:bacillithiol system redox-active protein YtxJ [Segetibacter sp.]MCW3081632.1 thioredoxin family protein [Segetibacter sp.]
MEFQSLQSETQLEKIAEASGSTIIFKHNTTCPISKSVKQKLEQDEDKLPVNTPVFILDLLSHRDISDAVAEKFDIPHQSPQLLVIKDGKCIYDEALYNISAEEAAQALEAREH